MRLVWKQNCSYNNVFGCGTRVRLQNRAFPIVLWRYECLAREAFARLMQANTWGQLEIVAELVLCSLMGRQSTIKLIWNNTSSTDSGEMEVLLLGSDVNMLLLTPANEGIQQKAFHFLRSRCCNSTHAHKQKRIKPSVNKVLHKRLRTEGIVEKD